MITPFQLSLRSSFLLLVIFFSLSLVSLNLFVLKPHVKEVVAEQSRQDIVSTVNRLQGTVEYLLSIDDTEGLKREISANSASRDVLHLLVLDEEKRILASSKLSEEGLVFDSGHLHISEQINELMRQTSLSIHESNNMENALYGFAPIRLLGKDGSRREQQGLLILEIDLQRRQASLLNRFDFFFWGVSIVIGAIGLLFWKVFNRSVSTRLATIVVAAQKIAKGQFNTRLNMAGDDELTEIANTIDTMASQLEEDHRELLNHHLQLESILTNIPSMVYIKDREGQYLMMNDRFKEAFPSVASSQGHTAFDILPKDEAEKFAQYDAEVLELGEPIARYMSFSSQNTLRQLHMVKFPLFDRNGCAYAICTIASDLSEQEQTETLLSISRSIFQNTVEAIIITDGRWRILDVNSSFERITGYSKEDVVGHTPAFLKPEKNPKAMFNKIWTSLKMQGHWTGELVSRKKSGEEFFKRLSVNKIMDRDGHMTGYIGIFQDVSKEKEATENLAKLAFTDPLTGLHNREAFKNKLVETIEYAKRYQNSFGVLFIDLDHFKEVNDSQGHEAGDKLLIMVAERLKENTRVVDVVSRLGGDEFTVLVPGSVTESGLAVMASQIIKSLSAAYEIGVNEFIIGCSIGIAIYPRDGGNTEQLLKHADAAMYHAKEAGRGCFSFFDFTINARNQKLIRVKQAMRGAIERNEYHLVYQPKVDPKRLVITGYEALLRWNSRDLGYVSPAEFIPVSEESGEIDHITDWVIHQVASDKQRSPTLIDANIAINISAKQFRGTKWLNTLRRLNNTGELDAKQITVEVTETALVDSLDQTLDQLKQVRRLGASIAIDDFGTGYSSLSYLKKMPIQYLKIDRTFVQDIGRDEDDQTIVQTVIAMSHAMGIKVIAEGAESTEQVSFLESKGCDEIQGFYYSRPLTLENLEAFHLDDV